MARNVWDCAVSLQFLVEFASSIPEHYTTSDVVEHIVKPATAEAKCRYVDLVPAGHVGHSTYFISHRWGCNFRAELVAVLVQRFGSHAAAPVAPVASTGATEAQAAQDRRGQQPGAPSVSQPAPLPNANGPCGTSPVDHAEAAAAAAEPGAADGAAESAEPHAAAGPPTCAAAAEAATTTPPPPTPASSVFLWLDIFAVNQHPNTTQADDLANLQNVIKHSEATVMLLDAGGAVLTRIWCLYEAWKTAEYKGTGGLRVVAPPTAVNYGALEGVFVRLDVRAAEATVESDRVRILAEVEASMGAAALNVYIKGALVDSAVIESNAALPAASAIAKPILEAISALRQREREQQAASAAAAAAAVAAAAEGSSEAAAGAGPGAGPGTAAQPPTTTLALTTPPAPPPPPPELMPLSPADGAALLSGAAACFRAARMLQFVANLRDAEMLIREALGLFTAAEGGGGGPNSLACLQALANILMPMKGRLEEARAVLHTTLQLSVKVHGPRHESTAALLNDLGLLAFWREDWAEAEQHFKTALVIYGERQAAMPPAAHTEAVLAATLSLGVVVGKQGPHRADEAEATLASALAGYSRRAGGKPDQGVAEARAHLGKLAEARGRHAEAEEHFTQAAVLSRQIFGSQHPAVADALAGVARQMAATGRLPAAAQLSRAAHTTAVAALGPGGSGLVDRLAAQLADHEARLAAAAEAVGAAEAEDTRQAPSQGRDAMSVAEALPAHAQELTAAAAEGMQSSAAVAPAAAEGAGGRTAGAEGVGGGEASAAGAAADPTGPLEASGVDVLHTDGPDGGRHPAVAAAAPAGLPAAAAAAEATAAAPEGALHQWASGTQRAVPPSETTGAVGSGAHKCHDGGGGSGGAADAAGFCGPGVGPVGGEVSSRADEGSGNTRMASVGEAAARLLGPARPPSGQQQAASVAVSPRRPSSSKGTGGSGEESHSNDSCTAGASGVDAATGARKAQQGPTRASLDGGDGSGGSGGGCGAVACLPPRWRRSGSGGRASNRVAPAPHAP